MGSGESPAARKARRARAKEKASGAQSTPEYKEAYNDEIERQMSDAPLRLDFVKNGTSDDIEAYMRNYASAIGDPVRAMERQKESVKRELEPYSEAKSAFDLGTKAALEEVVGQYDAAIDRMKKIKKDSKRPDLL